ncbi:MULTISPECIES: hypothetical protein [Kaistia]|uniref:Uncharacterized protein n=1 Tax=Kaistia nematophila TaxID=2994654 RepID=A0A9X3E2U7_9HYPH|nr:hypothetical protein [Kaistia nematophila]MCX5570630.1 hypothetical protein [Kaistia nematophila]
METIRINEDLIEIGGKARVERGPARKTAEATEALLSNENTAAHYQVSQPVLNEDGEQIGWSHRDALGQPILLGQPMAYLDWLAGRNVFYVYLLDARGKWQEDSDHPDEVAAIARATEIAAG